MSCKPSTILSFDQAREVFDWLAAMDDLAFGYIEEGCAARTHIMGRRLQEQKKLTVQKAWALPRRATISFTFPDGYRQGWKFHVAPVLQVRDGCDSRPMVFDPSLFDGPVTTSKWGAVMGKDVIAVYVADWGEVVPGYIGDYNLYKRTTERTDSVARRMVEFCFKSQESGLRHLFKSCAGDSTPEPEGLTVENNPIMRPSRDGFHLRPDNI